MLSNEDKNRNGNAESDSLGIDALTELSAEEIEKLLAEGAGTRPEEPEDVPQGDVLDMLEEAGDRLDVPGCFAILRATAQTACPTVVSMVFDPAKNRVFWCENRQWDQIKEQKMEGQPLSSL